MSWTKRQLIADAFGELALASYDFDIGPEEELAALRKLNTMLATWSAQGLQLGYIQNASAIVEDLDEPSGLALYAVEAVVQQLAVRIAASKGKALASSTLRTAKAAYDALISRLAAEQVQQQQLAAGTPRGAGRKPWRTINQPFTPSPNTSPLQSAADGGLTFAGEGN
jgi:hypothetical protein